MNNKKKYIVGVSLLLVSLITIGISYAYWMLTLKQEDKNIVTSDCFKITFTGENDINLTNAYPMHDDELYTFYQSATPYHFTITNTCESHASGVINLETLNSTKKLADDYVDVVLYEGTKNYLDIAKAKTESTDVYSLKGEGRVYNDINIYDYSLKGNLVNPEKVLTDSITAYKLHEFTLTPLETKEFNLLEYMSPDTPPVDDVMNATFESKITVTTSYQKAPLKMNAVRKRNTNDTTSVFQDEYISNATYISFEKTTEAPTTYVAAFDESEAQDGSIMAYIIADESTPSTYTIRFQTDGVFLMPEDCGGYFQGFSKVITIDGLRNVDTSQVTNMVAMFSNCRSLTSLDIKHFNVSNVTNMLAMFSGCYSLTSLDLSGMNAGNVTDMSYIFSALNNLTNLNLNNFNAGNVTDMAAMFSGLNKLKNLNLNGFNTSKVTTMSEMFHGCSSLTSLDLSSFNTSNVAIMTAMFQDCSSLTSLDLSGFDTSNVASMTAMFWGCSSLTDLDLGFFDTSNVTSMSIMFKDCSSLTSLDLGVFDTSKVEYMNSMFEGNSNLTSITYGSNFIRKSDSNITDMYTNCPANKPTDPSWDGAF